jgi:ribosomal protein S2
MDSSSLRLTTNQLMLSNVYMGDTSHFLDVKIKPFLLGYKSGYYILNFSFTQLQFKLLINILINIVSLRQKVLIVKDLDFFKLTFSLNYKNIFYYDKK